MSPPSPANVEEGRVYLPKPDEHRESIVSGLTSVSDGSSRDGSTCGTTCVAMMHACNCFLVWTWRILMILSILCAIVDCICSWVVYARSQNFALLKDSADLSVGLLFLVFILGYELVAIFLPLLMTMNKNEKKNDDFELMVTSAPVRVVAAWVIFGICTVLLILRVYVFFIFISIINAFLTPAVLLTYAVVHLVRYYKRRRQAVSSQSHSSDVVPSATMP